MNQQMSGTWVSGWEEGHRRELTGWLLPSACVPGGHSCLCPPALVASEPCLQRPLVASRALSGAQDWFYFLQSDVQNPRCLDNCWRQAEMQAPGSLHTLIQTDLTLLFN